jgi:type II secretory pathway component PulC
MIMRILYQKKFCRFVLTVVLFCACASYATQDANNSAFEKYSIIAERNIFSKYKTSAFEKENSANPVLEKKILSLYVLRGVSLRGEKALAFIEDEISGERRRLTTGESVAGYRIKSINLDSIVCEKDGSETVVKIGSELFRTESQVPSAQKSSGPPEKSIKTNDSAAKAGSSNDDVLKKMMERRKSQGGN